MAVDLGKIFDLSMMIDAIETEDEVGCVLRVHLMAEQILINFIELKKSSETEKYLGQMRDFGVKMAVATAMGMPACILQVLHHINRIRNDFAHRGTGKLDLGDVQNMQRFVDQMAELNPRFLAIKERGIEFADGRKFKYGAGGARIDFSISALSFLGEAALYLVKCSIPKALESGDLVLVPNK
ncbi:hypothetical protein FIV02_18415 [Pseudomonas sp. THAF187a]|uniref:hypothetical protein n=1 Tax=unclassified Pseudomonas TaxID=196821 RepID=UPI001267E1FC|nr:MULTISPECIES: hypothetical protein [unclassified Pseudomonas]QFT23551.1 hypothetical protein FIV02_18415 [Pseudomonas sp. THAF187a]QFT43739.1 hypothetical protein FIU98_18400 [Pseudomonas sp. THAF42]